MADAGRDFDGLAAVVTGAGSGIGAAVARLLLQRGAKVAALDLDPSGAPEGTVRIVCDVSSTTAVDEAIAAAARAMGGIDVLVNCAGVGAIGDVAAQGDEEWARLLDINVLGIVRTSRACLPHLRRSQRPAIVHIGSTLAITGVPARALYSASKGAVHSLTQAMAADHIAEAIRVNAVAPGTADTPWVQRLLAQAEDPTAAAEALRRRQPIGRLVTADEVAQAAVYLASPAAGSTTGSILTVDGGFTTLRLPNQ